MLLNMQKREKQDLLFNRSDADTDFFLKSLDPDTGFLEGRIRNRNINFQVCGWWQEQFF